MTSPGLGSASRSSSASITIHFCSDSSPGRPTLCPAMKPRGHSARGRQAGIDPAERVVPFDVERCVRFRPYPGGAHQAHDRLLQLALEGRERHAVAGQLERLFHRYLSLSSASMILSVGGCCAMSWM